MATAGACMESKVIVHERQEKTVANVLVDYVNLA